MNSPPRAAQRLFELGTCCSISERSGAGPATRAAALAARRGARPRADEPDGVRLRRLRRAVSANAERRHARRLARRASQRGAARRGAARKRRNARGRSVHRIGEIPPIDASGTGSERTSCRAPALQCAAAQLAGTLRRVVTRRAAAPACPVFRRSTPRRRPKRSRSTVAPLSGKPAHRGHHFVLFKKCIDQNYPPNHFHSCIAGLSLCKKHPLNNQTPFIKCNNQSDTHYFQNQVHDQIHPF
ncbi:hypothetical protein N4S61_10430 [Burkholderia pseudomallei]|uniref:hypothetical protein n=1 Tax=Burkholderia pseudomallei TaxID=28450 RepID=UPI0021B47DD9|nr:hypothetical protein [Burkholderia pseudomallei]MCT7346430.1 hypothetical protein [Burkholderia pseudomallei]MCT7917157.1 hypothetical protein [Burkholderia pseudomallei]